eukprot:9013798-Pyramimonas_sp.AAC.1
MPRARGPPFGGVLTRILGRIQPWRRELFRMSGCIGIPSSSVASPPWPPPGPRVSSLCRPAVRSPFCARVFVVVALRITGGQILVRS